MAPINNDAPRTAHTFQATDTANENKALPKATPTETDCLNQFGIVLISISHLKIRCPVRFGDAQVFEC